MIESITHTKPQAPSIPVSLCMIWMQNNTSTLYKVEIGIPRLSSWQYLTQTLNSLFSPKDSLKRLFVYFLRRHLPYPNVRHRCKLKIQVPVVIQITRWHGEWSIWKWNLQILSIRRMIFRHRHHLPPRPNRILVSRAKMLQEVSETFTSWLLFIFFPLLV